MIVLLAYFLKLLSAILCWKNKFKYVSIFLFISLLFDIIRKFIQYCTNCFPKPYHGLGFCLFFIDSVLFILLPVLLLDYIEKLLQSKFRINWILFIVAVFCILIGYPTLSGISLIRFYQLYYWLVYMYAIFLFIYKIKNVFSIEQGILLFLISGGMISIIISIIYGWVFLSFFNCCIYGFICLGCCLNNQIKQIN